MQDNTKKAITVLAAVAAVAGIYLGVRYFLIKSAYEKTLTTDAADTVLQNSLQNIDVSILDDSPEDDTDNLPHGNTDLSGLDDEASSGDSIAMSDNTLTDLQTSDVQTGMGDY